MTFFSIILGTFGDETWRERAQKLALDTVNSQDTADDFEVVQCHGKTLAQARNQGAWDASGDFLIFLDTDDLLDSGYVRAMGAATGDIRRPAVRGFTDLGFIDPEPVLTPRPTSLLSRNYIIIGAAVNRDMFLAVNGFDDSYPVLEDWDLWLKIQCHQNGTVVDVPDAVYLINDSHERNQHPEADQVAHDIRRKFVRWQNQ